MSGDVFAAALGSGASAHAPQASPQTLVALHVVREPKESVVVVVVEVFVVEVFVVVSMVGLLALALSVGAVEHYEQGVLFGLGKLRGRKEPGLVLVIPIIEVLRTVPLPIVTMPIRSQGIMTKDNVSASSRPGFPVSINGAATPA